MKEIFNQQALAIFIDYFNNKGEDWKVDNLIDLVLLIYFGMLIIGEDLRTHKRESKPRN